MNNETKYYYISFTLYENGMQTYGNMCWNTELQTTYKHCLDLQELEYKIKNHFAEQDPEKCALQIVNITNISKEEYEIALTPTFGYGDGVKSEIKDDVNILNTLDCGGFEPDKTSDNGKNLETSNTFE